MHTSRFIAILPPSSFKVQPFYWNNPQGERIPVIARPSTAASAMDAGTVWGEGITDKVVWHVVKTHARKLEIPKLAPHDLRRSCPRFCHAAGGELEQIQFLLGHVSVQTTESWGCKQRFREAVNDGLGIEPTE
jgi:hypothetical protein